jgi:hypothetical protein
MPVLDALGYWACVVACGGGGMLFIISMEIPCLEAYYKITSWKD